MSILHAAPAQVKPAIVILFDSASRRTPRPFGKGLLSYAPAFRVEYSAADAAWWAAESDRLAEARERAELDALVEEMAREHEACRAIESGLWC